MYRICIVTPDIIGPIKNGGIGTHCYWLAKLYASQPEHAVTVLFTSPWEPGFDRVINSYRRDNIDFIPLPPSTVQYPQWGLEWFAERASRVRQYLREKPFDAIYFQDWQANGFECVRAKKMGLDFHNTVLVNTLHSPHRWSQEASSEWSKYPTGDCKLHFAEQYACENSDVLVSPTHHMFEWAQSRGWRLPADHRVISCVFPRALATIKRTVPIDTSHLVFFGRLETRKGLEIFCGALNALHAQDADHGLRQITFLGKSGVASGLTGLDYVNQHCAKLVRDGIEVQALTNFDALQAGRFLRESGAVAVIPSLVDNHPYTVVECLEMGVPLLASGVGGIPELVHKQGLFEPTVKSLKETLRDRTNRLRETRSLYDGERAANTWLQLTSEFEDRQRRVKPSPSRREQPRVSVCVAHYNHGKFLPQLLRSLSLNDYPNFDVVVVDDGSTDVDTVATLHEEERKYRHRKWRFFTKDNGGPGSARNAAAAYATGELLLFMDADNIATRHMISTFVEALRRSGDDCLTCLMLAFRGDNPTARDLEQPEYSYVPLGAALEVGQVENVFGDTNFIMKKSVFDESDGFSLGLNSGNEDWEFLARIALKGAKLDVVPEALFYYRHVEDSFHRRQNEVAGRQRVAEAYIEYGGRLDRDLVLNHLVSPLNHICISLCEEVSQLQRAIQQRDERIAELQSRLMEPSEENRTPTTSVRPLRAGTRATLLAAARSSLVSSFQVARSRRAFVLSSRTT